MENSTSAVRPASGSDPLEDMPEVLLSSQGANETAQQAVDKEASPAPSRLNPEPLNDILETPPSSKTDGPEEDAREAACNEASGGAQTAGGAATALKEGGGITAIEEKTRTPVAARDEAGQADSQARPGSSATPTRISGSDVDGEASSSHACSSAAKEVRVGFAPSI